MPQLLNCQGISKRYGVRPLFEQFSLVVSSGDRIGIIGPNGAGKSTLLRIFARLETPDTGDVALSRGLRVNYLEQQDQLRTELTIGETLHSALIGQEPDEQRRQRRIAGVLEIVGAAPLTTPVGELSGGWRKRLAIACEIVKEPDILLLDEPTNHLDLEGITWLENFLLKAPFAFAAVSHDRTFLENVANRLLEISPRFPQHYFTVEGNYIRYLEKREEHLAALQRQEESLANSVRREMEWLRRGPKARGTKASARVNEAQRLIEELKQSRSRSNQKTGADIDFTATGRKTKRLLTMEGVRKSFGDRELFRDLDLVLSPGARVGLLGENGSGKTTLLNIIAGRLSPDEGGLHYASNVRTVIFDQSRRSLDPQLSLGRALAPDSDSVVFQGRSLHVAAYASRFLFKGESLVQPVGSLSGGEQARLLIARLMLEPADILLLDEPTNDLDIDTLEVLEESLEEFAGALVLVTHDRLMLNRICDLLIGIEPGEEAKVYADYAQWLSRSRSRRSERRKSEERTAKPKSTDPTKVTYKEKREWEQIELRIKEAEEELERCRRAVEDPETAVNAARLHEACIKLDEAQRAVDHLYERWDELERKVRPSP